MMTMKFAIAILVAAAAVAPAAAAPTQDPAAAVRALEAVAQVSPNDGGVAIELAAAYQRAGRIADANTTLRRALTLDNAMLETPTGDAVWSHQVAKRALARDVALTSR
jgi:Flp pilus assembly protein TadD